MSVPNARNYLTLSVMSRPAAFERLLDELTRLPGIGRRSAERIAFDLLKRPAAEVLPLAEAIRSFKTDLKACGICGNVTESDPCAICENPKRDRSRILVVEQPSDIAHLENTGVFRGLYHVLMGRLSPLDGIGPGELNIQGLLDRVEAGGVAEVILGTHPTFEGDGTAMFLAESLEALGVTVTQIARGVPTGSSIESVSKAVLSDAVQGRRLI